MKALQFIFLTISMAMLSLFAHAQVSFLPLADALVRGGVNSAFNYGADKEIAVKKDKYLDQRRESYLLFTVKDLKAVSQSTTVKLKLIVKNVATGELPSNYNLLLKVVADTTWTEGTGTNTSTSEMGITFTNKPAAIDVIATITGAQAEAAVTFDVTNYLLPLLKAGKRTFSFHLSGSVHLADSSTNGFFSFYSRENIKKAPLLIID